MREYRSIPPQDLMLGDKIGEGQFGDVHSGYLYPKVLLHSAAGTVSLLHITATSIRKYCASIYGNLRVLYLYYISQLPLSKGTMLLI